MIMKEKVWTLSFSKQKNKMKKSRGFLKKDMKNWFVIVVERSSQESLTGYKMEDSVFDIIKMVVESSN